MKHTWKKWTSVLLAMTLAVGVTACGGKEESAPNDKQATKGGEQQELTIMLDWYPNAVHSFLYAAEQQGYFKEENLKVNLQMPSDANDPLKLAAAGKVDAAVSYQTQVIQARSEGVPVHSVAAIVRHPLNIVMTRKDSGINSPKDLAGKNVGYPSVALDEYIARDMVKKDGGDDSGMKFTDIGFDIVPALTGKTVDAVVGGYINHERLLLEKNNVPVNVFKFTDYGVPDFYELVLATGDSTLEKKQAALEAFLRAAGKGQKWVSEHKDDAVKLLIAKQEKEFPLEEDVEKQSIDILIPLMDAGDKPFGYQDADNWKTTIAYMKDKKIISKDVTVDEVFKNLVK